MYVVTVEFTIDPQHVDEFAAAMRHQASTSLKAEVGCQQFDVCYDEQDRSRCFLYEKYDDQAAFALHLESKHMLEFNQLVAPWVKHKSVQVWHEEHEVPLSDA